MRAHRRVVVLASAASVLNKIFDLAPPALIGAAVDVVVAREHSLLARLGVVDETHQLALLTFLTVVIWGLESAFEYAFAWLWRNLAQTAQHELRVATYTHVQDLEMAFFEDASTGGLMSVLNDDINQLERFLDGGANDLIQVATTVVVVGATFIGLSPLLAVFAIAPMPFVVAASFAYQRRIAPRYAVVRERVGLLNGLLSNNLSGIETIKSFTAEGREVTRVGNASLAYQEANKEAIRLSAAFIPLIRMVIVVGFGATLILGGWLALEGTLAVGTYSVLVFLTQRLLWPLTRLGNTFDLYQRAMASTTRVLDLLDTTRQRDDGEQPLARPQGAVVFEDVSFAYPGRPPVLTGFSLALPAGATVGIVGSTGSGKSTLMRLLLRFYDPQSGLVTLDGHDLRDLRLAELLGAVGLVSQHVYLFSGTVYDNLTYGRPGATSAEVEHAARAAEAHDFIAAMPQGYDTPIGERGQKLSGGQRQRLSLARALLCDPPLLVLDEATSAVDNETEALIQRSLRRLAVGRTMLVIAHRLSTVRHADLIVVMEGGRVIERGRHEDLVASGGRYAALWAVQTGELTD